MRELASRCAANGFDPLCFGLLYAVEDKHFWFRARNRIISTLVRQIVADWESGYRILELGCGTGNVLRVLKRACPHGMVIGLDLFASGLQYARCRTSCDLVRADVRKLPFCAAFDLIGLFDVLEHLPDDNQVLRELHSVLRPHGVLILTVPAHRSLWSYFDEVSHHCRRYGASELEGKLSRAGYSVEYLTQFMASIFPVVWVKRRLTMRTRRNSRDRNAGRMRNVALGELRTPPFVNDLLTFLLSQEAHLLVRRRRLPIGTSLLAIARP